MSTSPTAASRAGAIARARAYVESGAFETELARRVAFRTESQKLPASLPELRRYLDEGGQQHGNDQRRSHGHRLPARVRFSARSCPDRRGIVTRHRNADNFRDAFEAEVT